MLRLSQHPEFSIINFSVRIENCKLQRYDKYLVLRLPFCIIVYESHKFISNCIACTITGYKEDNTIRIKTIEIHSSRDTNDLGRTDVKRFTNNTRFYKVCSSYEEFESFLFDTKL